jgi:hypothetical protein
MKKTKILSGNFSAGDGKKGNFSGYNTKGQRIFVNKKQMDSLGIKTDAEVKPFYAVIDEKEIDTFDANGALTGVMTKRLQALSVFKTEAELIDAVNADDLLEINAKSALVKSANAVGLTQAQLDAVLMASI